MITATTARGLSFDALENRYKMKLDFMEKVIKQATSKGLHRCDVTFSDLSREEELALDTIMEKYGYIIEIKSYDTIRKQVIIRW